jgi:WD40 repeat protein
MKQSSLLVSDEEAEDEEAKDEEDASDSTPKMHDIHSAGGNTEDDEDDGTSETGDHDESTVNSNRYDVEKLHSTAAIVLPRCRFPGACNVRTIKDGEDIYVIYLGNINVLSAVNFLGPDDEWVVSGSDDGNWFIWQKSTGELHDILEGDGAVVNVIEGHPHLPLVAVSGMDHTVKVCCSVPFTSKGIFTLVDSSSLPQSHRVHSLE